MKTLTALLFIMILSCTKPDSTMIGKTDPLYCVDCEDIISHVSWVDVFCGESDEADKFITEIKKSAYNSGMILFCDKHKHE